jgi:hypothetical protein
MPWPSSLVMQILAGAQYIKINLPKMSISQNLNLQLAVQNLSQINIIITKILSNQQQKNDWINISCTVNLLRTS